MQKKTIWIINQYASTPQTGIGGRHYYLAKELAKQGHKVCLIAACYTHLLHHPPKLNGLFEIQSIEGFDFIWVNVPAYGDAHSKRRVWNWFSFAWKLLKLPPHISNKPDVIFASSPSPFIFLTAKRLAKKLHARLAFEVRDIWPLTLVEVGGYSVRHPFVRLMQYIEDKAYRESDVVLSNLPNAVEHMVSRGLERSKFSWIPNGFDLEEVSNNQPLSEYTLQFLPHKKFTVGYTGTLGVANALDSFIEAAHILRDTAEVNWVLVGEGKEKSSLLAKCESLSLNNVYFIDSIPKAQIQSMLAKFDVCYIGLTKNPLFRFGVSPNKLFDYFYSSKPVLYAIDSGKYLPVNGANAGVSIPAENPQMIADAILKLKAMSPEELAELGKNGRDYVMKYHNYSNIADKLAKVLLG